MDKVTIHCDAETHIGESHAMCNREIVQAEGVAFAGYFEFNEYE